MAEPVNEDLDVVVVVDSLRDNGGLRVAAEYTRQWGRLGARATLAIVQDVDDVALAELHPDIRREFLTAHDTRFRWTWPLALARLVGLARRADVVVAGSETGIGLLLAHAAARIARRPFLVLVQAEIDDAIAYWVRRPLQRPTRRALSHADAVVTVADSLVPAVLANGLPPERASVVLNGVDVARIRARAGLPPVDSGEAVPRPRQQAEDVPTIVGHGRLSAQKDFPLLVEAHARVLARGVDHRLVIIGDGPTRDELAALVEKLGVTGSVRLAGYVDNPYPITSTADLFVLSSRTEGMPLTVLEAMAVGVPVLATRCGTGVEVLLEGGAYGELVPAASVDAMADAIERHLRDQAPLRARAEGGPRRALQFDVTTSARTILRTLAGLARRGTAAPALPEPRSDHSEDRSPSRAS